LNTHAIFYHMAHYPPHKHGTQICACWNIEVLLVAIKFAKPGKCFTFEIYGYYRLVWPSTHKNIIPTFPFWGHQVGWSLTLEHSFGTLGYERVSWGTRTQWKKSVLFTHHPSIVVRWWVLVHFGEFCNPAPAFLLPANFGEILTWKIWFQPMQRIFHWKKDPNLPDFYDKF